MRLHSTIGATLVAAAWLSGPALAGGQAQPFHVNVSTEAINGVWKLRVNDNTAATSAGSTAGALR